MSELIPGAIYGFRNDKSENWGPDTFVGYQDGKFVCREQEWKECSHNNIEEIGVSDFDEVLTARIQKIQEVLGTKAEEYARDGNRLHNFDVAARIGNTTPEQALKGMWMKHIVSVFDMIDAPETITVPMIDEKLGDLINYAILLEYMMVRAVVQATPEAQADEFLGGMPHYEDAKQGGVTDADSTHYEEE